MYIDNSGSVSKNGNKIISFNKQSSDIQTWIICNKNGNIILQNPQTKKCFVDTGKANKGSFYHIWECDKLMNSNQYITFEPEKIIEIPKKETAKPIDTTKGDKFSNNYCRPNIEAPKKMFFNNFSTM